MEWEKEDERKTIQIINGICYKIPNELIESN